MSTSPLISAFICAIRKELDRRQMSARELAKVTGSSQPYVSRVLNGQKNPSLEWVEKVTEALGLSVHFDR